MNVSSGEWPPPGTSGQAEYSEAAPEPDGKSLQSGQAQSHNVKQPSSPSAALKRGIGPSAHDERSSKHRHCDSSWQQTSRPKPKTRPNGHAGALLQSARAGSPREYAEGRAHPSQSAMTRIARDKPAALVKSPLHAPIIDELRQVTLGNAESSDPDTVEGHPQYNSKPFRSDARASKPAEPPPPQHAATKRSSRHKYAMILQPDSTRISEEQLAAEIKGIYEGVVTVEIKCMDIDAALARDTKSHLGVEQWQALIALHRTLLYEHHDFLMATQHPSASDSLKTLATKYSMPARMWKHGIHAFLEVLRHRRPDSQDYMLAFVVLAYQMMALLFETVPCFTDTWIECLGDLARYRMAIEDDREMHAVWGGVAARWYTLASDRHPEIGRLYHHLGILERPSMRKYSSYAKSLTATVPFVNARDSLTTFCKPIIQEENLTKSNVGSAEALLVTFFALVFMSGELDQIQSTASSGLKQLLNQPSAKTRQFGPHLVLTSIASLFEFGSSQNHLWRSFSTGIGEASHHARPSAAALPGSTQNKSTPSLAATSAAAHVTEFYFDCINALTRAQSSAQATTDLLASVHTVLAWFHSVHSLGSQTGPSCQHTGSQFMDPNRFSWGGICQYINGLCQNHPISECVFEFARQGSFPGCHEPHNFVPLAEDYEMRGHQWAQLYLPKDLLPAQADEIESPLSDTARLQRVQWLALSLAFRTEYMKYDVHNKSFCTSLPGPLPTPYVDLVDSIASTAGQTDFAPSSRSTTWAARSSVPTSPISTSRSSTTMSTAEDSDGFTLVPPQKSKPDRSWAKVAAAPPKKARPDTKNVRIAGHYADDAECVQ